MCDDIIFHEGIAEVEGIDKEPGTGHCMCQMEEKDILKLIIDNLTRKNHLGQIVGIEEKLVIEKTPFGWEVRIV